MTQAARTRLPYAYRLMLALMPCVTTAVFMAWLHSGWAAILAYHAVILASLATWTRGAPINPFGGRWTPSGITACVLSAAAAGPLLSTLLPFMARGGLSARLAENGLSGGAWLLFIPYFALVNPVLEEMFWRGLLRAPETEDLGVARHGLPRPASRERRRGTAGSAGFMFDILFAAYHLVLLPNFVSPPYVALAGVALVATSAAWRVLADRSGGLLPATIAHILTDIGIIVAVIRCR